MKMAYVYLTDMFQFVDERLSEAEAALAGVDSDPGKERYEEGRCEALTEFKRYLKNHYIPKLPNRIRKSYLDNRK